MRLGVSPAAASTPTGVFSQRFEASFPCPEALGCVSASLPSVLVYLCANVGLRGLLAAAWPAPLHNPHLAGSASRHLAVSPLHPGCPSPPLLLVWMNVSSLSPWLSVFHTVGFSFSSGCFLFLNCCPFGCARRRSVSTYASILARRW